MARKKILFISYFFPPVRSVESVMALNAVKYLTDCDVTVVAADSPRHFASAPVTLPPHIRMVRVKAPNTLLMHALYSLKFTSDPEIAWLPFARKKIKALLRDESFDAVISRANPVSSHLAVPNPVESRSSSTGQGKRVPWIAMYGDPGALHPYIKYSLPFLKALHMRVDRKVIARADRIIVTNGQAKKLFADAYGHAEKMSVLPNTYDPEEFGGVSDVKQGGGKLSILHAGSFYNLRSPKYFLAGYRLFLKRHPEAARNTEAVFAGSLGKYERLARSFGKNVSLIGNLSRDALKEEYARSDALLLIEADIPQSPFLPAKLAEYFAAKRPILALTPANGASADAIREANAGTIVPPSDEAAIATALEDMYSRYTSHTLFSSFFPEVVEKYSARSYGMRLSEIIQRTIKSE